MLRRLTGAILLVATLALYPAASCAAPPPPPVCGPPASPGLQGAWLSPDWILPGPQTYDEARVREAVRAALTTLEKQGINTVFIETLLRGTSIAPASSLPVYPHLRWAYDRRGRRTIDTLQIVIDEAEARGIAVHAWVHLFYWRMDNDDVFKPWQRSPSLWDDLLARWLDEQRARLVGQGRRGGLARVLARASDSIRSGGVDGPALSGFLREAGYEPQGRPLGCLVRALLAAGCAPPDFLLVGSADDPFPPAPNRSLCPIYLDPASPRVRQRIIQAICDLSESHPDLDGIQIDHARFPTEAQGIPPEMEPRGRDAVYFNRANPILAERYARYRTLVDARKQTLTTLVRELRDRLQRRQQLSAAVLPLYYVERSDGTDRFNGYDYAAQDWQAWPVDFVVPMMYGFDPWRIRTLVRRFASEARAAAAAYPAPRVVPGVSRLNLAKSKLIDGSDFVFFDLRLGLDVQYEKDRDEDFTWAPRRDP